MTYKIRDSKDTRLKKSEAGRLHFFCYKEVTKKYFAFYKNIDVMKNLRYNTYILL